MAAPPNPLSMFTTATPDAQLFSIPRSAVTPPKAGTVPDAGWDRDHRGTHESTHRRSAMRPSIPATAMITREPTRAAHVRPVADADPATPTSYSGIGLITQSLGRRFAPLQRQEDQTFLPSRRESAPRRVQLAAPAVARRVIDSRHRDETRRLEPPAVLPSSAASSVRVTRRLVSCQIPAASRSTAATCSGVLPAPVDHFRHALY